MCAQGLIIVVSAPSGAGKSTLCNHLVRRLPSLTYSISYTTRPRRSGERDGIDYFFVGEEEFRRMAERGAFVEWARVHDCYYGTPRRELEETVRGGTDVILDIDVQGGMRIHELYPEAVLIYVMTPSLAELESRLRSRNKDSDEVIRKRLVNARRELGYLPRYDYLVINDDVERALGDMGAIITAEHRRVCRLPAQPEFE